jgi:hypothetical protein
LRASPGSDKGMDHGGRRHRSPTFLRGNPLAVYPWTSRCKSKGESEGEGERETERESPEPPLPQIPRAR